MEHENAKAIEILSKVIVKLQDLVKELEPPARDPAPEAAVPKEREKIFGIFGGKPHSKKGAAKKTKKVKGGADIDMSTKASMVYNISDLRAGVGGVAPNVMEDGSVTSLQYLPQPFTAGNNNTFTATMKQTIEDNDFTAVSPSIVSGGAKRANKRTSNKAKK